MMLLSHFVRSDREWARNDGGETPFVGSLALAQQALMLLEQRVCPQSKQADEYRPALRKDRIQVMSNIVEDRVWGPRADSGEVATLTYGWQKS
jgi:hypothetical protein